MEVNSAKLWIGIDDAHKGREALRPVQLSDFSSVKLQLRVLGLLEAKAPWGAIANTMKTYKCHAERKRKGYGGGGTFFYSEGTVLTTEPLCVILLRWIYHNKDLPLQNKIQIH